MGILLGKRMSVAGRQQVRLYSAQGFTSGTPQPSKSAVLRVARVASREWAIAAICASNSDDRTALRAACGGNFWEGTCGLFVEGKDAFGKILP